MTYPVGINRPRLNSNKEAFDIILKAGRKAGYTKNSEYSLGIDAAANEFYSKGSYVFKRLDKKFTPKQLHVYYTHLADEYPLISIEDPFMEDAWGDFSELTNDIGKKCQIVGDDLYTTNPARIEKGIFENSTNAILIKPNQIGTLKETVDAINIAREARMKIIISHRSGDTSDTFISDLAVACGAEYIKAGSVSRSERLSKYNRLLEIEKFEL